MEVLCYCLVNIEFQLSVSLIGTVVQLRDPQNRHRKVNCLLTKNMKDNYEYWIAKIQEEETLKNAAKELELSADSIQVCTFKCRKLIIFKFHDVYKIYFHLSRI